MNAQTESKSILDNPTVLERAINYGRVSGDDTKKEGRNIEGQLEMGREYCQEKGYRIIAELYEDPKKYTSGHDIDLPVLNQIREMAHNGEFDVLVVRELDRLSRNLAKQLIVEEELNRAGVRVEYVLAEYDDTPEGRLQKHIRATVAEYEREKIKERMVRGRRNKVKSGKPLVSGHPPYGYRIDGNGELIIYEPEAAIIRIIFSWYVKDGLSSYAIVDRLNEMKAPPPTNSIRKNRLGWGQSTVNYILSSETYAGVWHYGKTNRHEGRKSSDQWLSITVPALISSETFEAVQDRKRQNKTNAQRNRKYDYLLSGRLKCICCGNSFTGQETTYYVPPRRKGTHYSQQCTLPYFHVAILDKLVWDWVKSILTDSTRLEKGLTEYRQKQEERNAPFVERLKVVDRLLSENRKQLERLLDLYLAGEFSREMLTERKERLEKIIASLEKEYGTLKRQLSDNELTEDQINDIKAFTEYVTEGIDLVNSKFPLKRRIIERLDVRVRATVENGKKVIYIECRVDKHTLIVPNAINSNGCNTSHNFSLLVRFVV